MLNLSSDNLHWIAGFMEGEACFGRTFGRGIKTNGSLYIQVSQVELDPLEKLQKLLGGSINKYSQDTKTGWRDYYRWQVCGITAEKVMVTVYPLMFSKRQKRISELLIWASHRPKTKNNSVVSQAEQLLNKEK